MRNATFDVWYLKYSHIKILKCKPSKPRSTGNDIRGILSTETVARVYTRPMYSTGEECTAGLGVAKELILIYIMRVCMYGWFSEVRIKFRFGPYPVPGSSKATGVSVCLLAFAGQRDCNNIISPDGNKGTMAFRIRSAKQANTIISHKFLINSFRPRGR